MEFGILEEFFSVIVQFYFLPLITVYFYPETLTLIIINLILI